MSFFTYSSCHCLSLHVVTVAILGAAGCSTVFCIVTKMFSIQHQFCCCVSCVVPFAIGSDVTLLIVLATCCFAIHGTSVLVAKACGLVKSLFDICRQLSSARIQNRWFSKSDNISTISSEGLQSPSG